MKQSRARGKQKGHDCASSIVGMVGTTAVEECCDARMTFVKL